MSNKTVDLYVKLKQEFGADAKLLFRVIRSPDYQKIVQDLVAYTGLSFDEVCQRIVLKADQRRHFVEEFKWENPSSINELNWFYRSNRGYLFGNAARPVWSMLDILDPKVHSPVLDFGGGVGNNSLWLAEQGFQVIYFDISIIQSDFVRFRAMQRELGLFSILQPYCQGRFNFIESLPMGVRAVVMQDVLEHLPNYRTVLAAIVERLHVGGLIIEYSPFNGKSQGKKIPRYSPVHFVEEYPLEKAMTELKMEKTELGRYPATVWRKGTS